MHKAIGLLGGSFNPIHFGHLAMASASMKALELDRLLIIPVGDPPHKWAGLAPKHHRLRMAQLAAGDRFEVSALEVERPGKTYTVDTLETLHELYPGTSFIMIIGADTLHEIAGWRNAPRVFQLCSFAVFARNGMERFEVPGAEIIHMSASIPDISATLVRRRIHQGLSLENYVPSAVEAYIGSYRLYDPPIQMQIKAIHETLRNSLPQERYRHTLGVVETIKTLAEHWSYDVQKAGLTGLLHDCAKAMPLDVMNRYLDQQGLVVDDARRMSTALLHAPASAAMARSKYGVTDPEILHAIRYHNTATVPMNTLDKLLCVADMTEPTRKNYAWMAPLRLLSYKDLDAAVCETLRQKLSHIERRGYTAHPDTAKALHAMERYMEERKETI